MKRFICAALVFALALFAVSAKAGIAEERAALIEAYPELEAFDGDVSSWDAEAWIGSLCGCPEPCECPPPCACDSAAHETAAQLIIGAPAALLMEKETGTVLFAQNEREPRPPASVTKVMTMLLIMEALDGGVVTFDDKVPVSAYAMKMGGSQVYLHEGEQYTVRELLKAIVVASGNDASVAMAEYLAGSEETFVARMNERAAELGMTDTRFLNCSGLPEDGHVTSARDIALMSRELTMRHPGIREYSTIWMDSLRDGTFTLSNTNKLVRFYPGATGLKTGSTSLARYCLSATAERGGMELIAVVMAAETSDIRFESARKLLDFGFANYELAPAYPDRIPLPVPVTLGVASEVMPELASDERLLVEKMQTKRLERAVTVAESVTAPVEKGQKLGEVVVSCDGHTIATVPIVAADAVPRLNLWQIFARMLRLFFMA
ncbi:MAG: D-alanyl-D-alanine carboxypeptidase [Oscillospiraceae bacterium]|nr:D-alanyl-D-alanine carboxypeptidase [Oscillospiraceae bacterium]